MTNLIMTFMSMLLKKIRTYWDIPNGPIEDLRYVVESHGVLVSCSAVDADSIDAFSSCLQLKDGERANVVFVIVIAAGTQSICRARFDMAHELAHIVLHPWSTEEQETISSEIFRLRERQANAVASSLLMPKEEFIADLDIDPTNLAYYLELKKTLGCLC
ncbi:ImmA/IrrE family metallo-endopeptidase [Bifidobacterium bifidum]|uniref:ImmA/IrrE family metallo-endopeptidase n=1 Tax=Bifidobacterium bifidum TaxID=1681 RepID=UPI00178CF2B2|nr:ImmA/IrrE family metallo-endopeptidase [Bifidobacterium bifidum]